MNPFGLLYDEVTASNLVTLDLAGTVLDAGSSAAGVNLAGYVLHSAIHETRPDVRCALHVHLPDAVAVSAGRVPRMGNWGGRHVHSPNIGRSL